MGLISKLEYEKRIRIVQEWILEDFPVGDIKSNMDAKWGISERQAQRYIKEARKRWVADEDILIAHKRKLRVLKLQKLSRSLKDHYKGTPEGIKALLAVEKEIISLEALRQPIKLEHSGANGKPIQTENVGSKIDYQQLPDDVLRAIVNARMK